MIKVASTLKSAHQPEMGPTSGNERRRIKRVAPPDEEVKGHEEKTANEHCEDLWDEIEGGGQIQTRHLESAPRFADEPLDLAPLSPKLAFQLGSVRLPIPAHGPDFPEALGEMMKTAAKVKAEWWTNFKRNLKNTAETLLTGGEKVPDPKNAKQLLKDTTSMTSGQKAQLGALIGLGAVAAGTAWYASRRRAQERQYDEVLALVLKDPAMQQASDWRQMVPEAYRFMQRYAPTLAQDPAMARAFCRSVAGSSGVDLLNYRVASELAAAEKMYHEAGTSGGPMRDIEFFLRHPLTKAVSGGGGGGGGKK